MRTSPPRPRLVALLLALIPGLLLTGSESVRVCLHMLVGAGDACLSGAAPGAASCCARTPTGPTVTDGSHCEGCCVELAGHAKEEPSVSTQDTPSAAELALPSQLVLALLPPSSAPALRAVRPAATSPPGHGAPTPLRL